MVAVRRAAVYRLRRVAIEEKWVMGLLTSLRALLLSSVVVLGLVLPAQASTPRARAYLATRGSARITPLTLSEARRSSGHQGQIVEWAGTVQGVALTGEGAYLFLRLADGQTIPMSAKESGTLPIGSRVYVIGRVSEKSGLIHHLQPLAIAPCDEVKVAYDDNQRRAEVARRASAPSAPSAPSAATASVGNPGQAIMRMDPRRLAARAGTLSLQGATSWIQSFNKGLDRDNATTLARTILYYCGQYRVDSRLALSLFAAESCFRHDATSVVGAMGIGQLMPETAQMLGVRDPYDAVQNAEGSIRHMSTLLSRWRGSPSQYQLTLASYNAGAGAVEQYGGIPPYPETINYVHTILGYYGELCHYQ